jgi:hypothetical protein
MIGVGNVDTLNRHLPSGRLRDRQRGRFQPFNASDQRRVLKRDQAGFPSGPELAKAGVSPSAQTDALNRIASAYHFDAEGLASSCPTTRPFRQASASTLEMTQGKAVEPAFSCLKATGFTIGAGCDRPNNQLKHLASASAP